MFDPVPQLVFDECPWLFLKIFPCNWALCVLDRALCVPSDNAAIPSAVLWFQQLMLRTEAHRPRARCPRASLPPLPSLQAVEQRGESFYDACVCVWRVRFSPCDEAEADFVWVLHRGDPWEGKEGALLATSGAVGLGGGGRADLSFLLWGAAGAELSHLLPSRCHFKQHCSSRVLLLN